MERTKTLQITYKQFRTFLRRCDWASRIRWPNDNGPTKTTFYNFFLYLICACVFVNRKLPHPLLWLALSVRFGTRLRYLFVLPVLVDRTTKLPVVVWSRHRPLHRLDLCSLKSAIVLCKWNAVIHRNRAFTKNHSVDLFI